MMFGAYKPAPSAPPKTYFWKFNGDATDSIGGANLTTTGSPTYV